MPSSMLQDNEDDDEDEEVDEDVVDDSEEEPEADDGTRTRRQSDVDMEA